MSKEDFSDKDIDKMLAMAFIEDPLTRKYAVELVMGRPVTPMELASGVIHQIIITRQVN